MSSRPKPLPPSSKGRATRMYGDIWHEDIPGILAYIATAALLVWFIVWMKT